MPPVTVDRDSRVRVFSAGGFSGGLIGTPVDITLDKLSDDDFKTVKEIIDLLQSPTARLEYCPGVGVDYGDFVEIGARNSGADWLTEIFNGYFARTPVVVRELENILKKSAAPSDLCLKP